MTSRVSVRIAIGAAIVVAGLGGAVSVSGLPLPSSVVSATSLRLPEGATIAWSAVRFMPLDRAYRLDSVIVTGKAGIVLRAASVTLPREALSSSASPDAVRLFRIRGLHIYAVAGWSGTVAALDAHGLVLPPLVSWSDLLLDAASGSLLIEAFEAQDVVVDGPSSVFVAARLRGSRFASGGFAELAADDLSVRGRASGTVPPGGADRPPTASIVSLAIGGASLQGAPPPAWRPTWIHGENASGAFQSADFTLGSLRWSVVPRDGGRESQASLTAFHLFPSDPSELSPAVVAAWPDGVRFSSSTDVVVSEARRSVEVERFSIQSPGAGEVTVKASLLYAASPRVPHPASQNASKVLVQTYDAADRLSVVSASVTFADAGLISKLSSMLAQSSGGADGAVRRMSVGLAPLSLAVPNQPDVQDVVGAFLRRPGTLSLSFTPASPVRLQSIVTSGPAVLGGRLSYLPPT